MQLSLPRSLAFAKKCQSHRFALLATAYISFRRGLLHIKSDACVQCRAAQLELNFDQDAEVRSQRFRSRLAVQKSSCSESILRPASNLLKARRNKPGYSSRRFLNDAGETDPAILPTSIVLKCISVTGCVPAVPATVSPRQIARHNPYALWLRCINAMPFGIRWDIVGFSRCP